MKLSVKFAGLCGSGTFAMILYTAFFMNLQPIDALTWVTLGTPSVNAMKFLQIFLWALAGASVSGYLGHSLGAILSHPKGRKSHKRLSPAEPVPSPDTKVGLVEETPLEEVSTIESPQSPASPVEAPIES
jgi:hypothetical protein